MTAPAGPVAAIDCGTNSTRLLVADAEGKALDRRMRITRLGQAVDATGRLAPEAVERTLDTLREYRDALDGHGVSAVRMTATSAARDAANRDDLFAPATAIVGTPPELLSGDEEARLSFLGAVSELGPNAVTGLRGPNAVTGLRGPNAVTGLRGPNAVTGPFLVVDIGGGSTEFAVGTTEPEGVISVDIGCVRITEKFLRSDPPSAVELSQALSVVRDYLDDVAREIPAAREARQLVGLAGTVTTVAAVEQGLAAYDRDRIHHFVLTRDAAEDVFRTLATERRADRIHNPGLEPGRADVIVGGAAILVAVMRYFEHPTCLVSESDILDGLVLSLLDR
ncbi:MAG TPA: Ppx/GppA phosphatase family protein [Acidimicrobiales bacterium]|nr:Ppx/GppA phosphatase family protein [Acidimicrobiales bacterium]